MIEILSQIIKEELTPDLLKKGYTGHCYIVSEVLQHFLGKEEWKPQNINHEGVSHWYLRNRTTGEILDITKDQFQTPVPYENGRGRGFLTKSLSKRAQILKERVKLRLLLWLYTGTAPK